MKQLGLELIVTDGKKKAKLADETKYLAGGVEGPWWRDYSWWVISEGLFLLISPWVMLYTRYVPPGWVFTLILGIFVIPPLILHRHRVPVFVGILVPILLVFSLVWAMLSSDPKQTEIQRSQPQISSTTNDEEFRTTIVLPGGETDDEETYRSSIYLSQ